MVFLSNLAIQISQHMRKLAMKSFPLGCCWKKWLQRSRTPSLKPPILGDASNGMFWANAMDKVSAQVNGCTWENQHQNCWPPQIGKENHHEPQKLAETYRLRGKILEFFGSPACYIGLGRVNCLWNMHHEDLSPLENGRFLFPVCHVNAPGNLPKYPQVFFAGES